MAWTQDDLEALYARLEKPLYNVVYRRLWDPEESHDVVQESFLKLWSMRRRVVAETVEALVYRIALNLARSRLRKRRIWRFLAIDSVGPAALTDPSDAEKALVSEQRQSLLRRAIGELPADLRNVMLLSEFGKLKYAQIADAMKIPEGTVASRRNRAMRLLRERLTEP